MKKLVLYTVIILLGVLIGLSIAHAQQRIDLNVRYGEYRVRVDLKPRILIIQNDGDTLRMQWFTNSAFEEKMKFLGQEVYQNGKKVVDTFKEND